VVAADPDAALLDSDDLRVFALRDRTVLDLGYPERAIAVQPATRFDELVVGLVRHCPHDQIPDLEQLLIRHGLPPLIGP
jgi:hypothetical protein